MRLPLRRATQLLASSLIAVACVDQGGVRVPVASRVVGDSSVVELRVAESRELAIECLDASGRVVAGAQTAWAVYDESGAAQRPGRVVLDGRRGRAVVRAISEGVVFVLGGCMSQEEMLSGRLFGFGDFSGISWFRVDVVAGADTSWTLEVLEDTLRLRAPSLEDSVTAATKLISVRSGLGEQPLLDPDGFSWATGDSAVVTVSAGGVVRAVGLGSTVVHVLRRGAAESLTRSVPVRVLAHAPSSTWDIAILDAHWTQGSQDEQQRVPIVRNGRAAAVNVTAFASAGAPASAAVLEVWNAAGQLLWTARAALVPDSVSAPSFARPSAQMLVPRVVLQQAARWRVSRDTAGGADGNASNDAWPRSGTSALRTVTAPPLELRLVPLRLADHGNAVLQIGESERVYYDSIARIRLPIANVVITVAPPLTIRGRLSSAEELAVNPSAARPLWMEALDAVDQRRLASGSGRSAYWVGVLPKPTPESRAGFGGMAWVPSDPNDIGPMSRSMVVRGHDWYPSPVSTGGVVAHELGHNFGLLHAPCGDPGFLDRAYPVPNGGVGRWVHWVSAWEHGSASSAATIDPTRGDFMSYCSGGHVSPYHMLAMIEWRNLTGASLQMAPVTTRVLSVRGLLGADGIVLRTPTFMEAEAISANSGNVLVELLAADGRVLTRGSARMGRLSEGTEIPFVAHIPVQPSLERSVAQVRVSYQGQSAQVVVQP